MDLQQIDQAIESYQTVLDDGDVSRLKFFRGLWDVQETFAQRIDVAAQDLPSAKKAEQWYWDEKPFFLMEPVVVDKELFVEALEAVAQYLAHEGGFEQSAAEALLNVNWADVISKTDLALAGKDPSIYLERSMDVLDKYEESVLKIATLALAFALKPFLEGRAHAIMNMLAEELKEGNTVHDKPIQCPACGGHAIASYVGAMPSSHGNGRLLYCGLCGTQWEYERIRCACCGTRNQGKLHYYHIEGDEAHRLHNCDNCGDYMRTAFQDNMITSLNFEVEDVVMARLDKVAHDSRLSMNKEA